MPSPLSFGKIEVSLTAGSPAHAGTPQPDAPFRILLLGDFSGRANRELSPASKPVAERRPVVVDRDNSDQVMSKLGVELHLPIAQGAGTRMQMRFSELEDFHPDRIFQRLEAFQALRELRARLSNPSTFATAAAELRSWTPAKEAPTSSDPGKQTAATPPPASENLLAQILGETPGRQPQPQPMPGGVDWSSFLQKIVQPHLVAKADPRQAELVAQIEQATSAQMRAILHHPDFQALDAAWRAVHFLIRRLDTDNNVKLYLLDISKSELAADLLATEELPSTGIYRLLVEQTVGTPGAQPWAVLAGAYTFERTPQDVQVLGRIARIARRAGAPFLAAADESVLGCASLAATPNPEDWKQPADPELADLWQSLRQLPEAEYLGLALPRILLRLPYGKDTTATDQFHFEEMPPKSRHACYLWGSPAFACVYLLAEAFSRHGWSLRPGVIRDIDGLPLHTYEEDGETRIKPCAEVVLTARAAERILSMGIMPFLSMPNRDAVQLARFQSLADPATPLAGRWQ